MKTNRNKILFSLLIIAVVAATVTAILVPKNYTSAKYTSTVSGVVHVTASPSHTAEEKAIQWLVGAITEKPANTEHTAYKYWWLDNNHRYQDNESVLDSTGTNYGVYISRELAKNLLGDESKYSDVAFCYTHSTQDKGNTNLFTVYYVNQHLPVLPNGTVITVENVYRIQYTITYANNTPTVTSVSDTIVGAMDATIKTGSGMTIMALKPNTFEAYN